MLESVKRELRHANFNTIIIIIIMQMIHTWTALYEPFSPSKSGSGLLFWVGADGRGSLAMRVFEEDDDDDEARTSDSER